ncbi:MAG TPA: mechanosensitive ion channel family protein [Chitinophagaceae bacterium]|nr:mechanosensitive ion channel family protein [Chitinophagaceae bacterium]
MEWDWKKFYDKAFDWLLAYGPRFVLAIVVFLVGLWMIRLFNKWIKKGFEKRKRFNPTIRYFLQNLVAISLQILLVFLALQVAGIQLTFFAAIVAGLSVAVGLALSGTLQNFVSGILILVLRPYSVGENVVMQGQEGTVTSIQLFYTTILTFDNKTIIVPNGQLSNNVIVNLSRQGKRRLDISIKLSYITNTDEVKKIIAKAIRSTKDILNEPVARVGVTDMEFDRYGISIQVWVNAHGFEDAKFILYERIMNDLKNAEIIAGSK